MSSNLMRNLMYVATFAMCVIVLPGAGCPSAPANLLPVEGALTEGALEQADPAAPDQPPEATNPDGNAIDRSGIYVTNFNGNSVTIYPLGASGDAAPKRTISGAATGINNPLGIARDTLRQIYVANRSGCNVTVYAAGAGGDAAPIRTLTDPNMGSPEGLAIGIDDGVFVSNCPTLGGCGGVAGVFHFVKDTATSDYNISGANTGITVPVGLALDEARDLFVANAFGGTVNMFAPGQSGNQFPTRSFFPGGNTQSIAYGSASILLGAGSVGVRTYHSTASGPAPWVGTLPNVGYTGGIYMDTDVTPPVIYVADFFGNAIHILQTVGNPPFLSINAVTTISGPATGLDSPYGVLVVKI